MSDVDDFFDANGLPEEPPKATIVNLNDRLQQEFRRTTIPILTSGEFVGSFRPPDYLWPGVAQRGNLYGLTGKTGSGKTAVALRLLATVALGRMLGVAQFEQGRALMLCGENPDDVRARWIALSEHMGFDDQEIDVAFIPGIFPIADLVDAVRERAQQIGELAFINIDTSAAFFPGDDDNSNVEAGNYARVLRTITTLPGRPCTIVNCHPTKNCTEDNLLPRGGGAFLNELDGNLTCKGGDSADRVVVVHWAGKHRGPDFPAVAFKLETVTSPRLVDSKGRKMPTVIAQPISEAELVHLELEKERDLRSLISVLSKHPGASQAVLAEKAGWFLADGKAYKSKVSRLLQTLEKQKLAVAELGKFSLTAAGKKIAEQAAE